MAPSWLLKLWSHALRPAGCGGEGRHKKNDHPVSAFAYSWFDFRAGTARVGILGKSLRNICHWSEGAWCMSTVLFSLCGGPA